MKKSKLLTTAVLAATLTLSCGLLAACGNEHTHTYSTDWSKDATGHWHVATCDDLKEGDKEYKKDFAAHAWGDDDECDVCKYVKPASPATEISLNKTELALSIAKTEDTLVATLNGTGTVTWSSSDETVVQVGEETGAVEALKPGTATITATITGTEIKETCAVTVADAYYVIGGMDAAWNKVAAFGDANVVYFMPTETEGVYKTKSFELPKLGNFQIAPVGDTTGDWYKKAFNGDYIKPDDTVLSKNLGGNIAVEKHGKYTVTLDLTGEKAVVSGVCDEEINDGEVKDIYYIIGTANTTSGWTLATDVAAVGNYAFTENEDGTHSLTVDLARGTEFKVAIVGMQWNGALDEAAIPRKLLGDNNTATVETAYKLTWTNSENIGVGLSGKYTFTLDPDGGEHNVLSYTFETTEATETAPAVLRYFIKGSMDAGWNSPWDDTRELKAVEGQEGVYELTISLDANVSFGFRSALQNEDGSVNEEQKDWFGYSAFTIAGNTASIAQDGSNYKSVSKGTYKFTLNLSDPENKTLTVAFTADEGGATTPDTPEA
jgi:hypothetical protein